MIESVIHMLDWLYSALVGPLFSLLGRCLALLLLAPMTALRLPVLMQVVILGGLTGLLSLWLRRRLQLARRDEAFQRRFNRLKAIQQPIGAIGDWRAQDVLYRASDTLLDEEYNAYLARRFARHVMTYLLPIFGVMAWLDAMAPWPPSALALPVAPVFLLSYATVVFGGLFCSRRQRGAAC